MFGARALGICKSVKIPKQDKYITRLPNVSDRGARINGPIPSIITNPVVHAMTMFVVVSSPLAICSIPGVNIELAKGERMAIEAIVATLSILRV